MEYQKALEIFNAIATNTINLGLERLIKLLDQMGNPQNELKFIHVAGTNGKGSIVKMLSNIITCSGYVSGLYISPFVLDFREQFQIDGTMITPEEFGECAGYVYDFIDFNDPDHPTQYEIQTAIAFEWFYRRGCDLVCLEVGLGGQDDATNVIQSAIMHIIGSISHDHQDILGSTIYEITLKKAGIIKTGPTVVYPLQDKIALDVIAWKCQSQNSELIVPDLESLVIEPDDLFFNKFVYQETNYHKSLNGKVQIYNCLTVIDAVHKLQALGYAISDECLQTGINRTGFPARMEILNHQPLVILDGSHNLAGAQGLAELLRQYPNRKITLIMGVLKDKDYEGILKLLAPLARRFFAVTPTSHRALPAVDLALVAQPYCLKTYSFEDIKVAVAAGLDLDEDDILVVCGSLYLALEIRPLLLGAIANSIK